MWRNLTVTLACGVLGLAVPTAARGEARLGEIYELQPAVDLAALAVAATFSTAWFLRADTSPAFCAPDCTAFRGEVNAFDRPAAGNWNQDWSNAGDAVVYAVLAGSLLTLGIDGGGIPGALEEFGVVTQAFVFSSALSVIGQSAADRPRPFMYGTSAPLDRREKGDGDMSFLSGHTAGTFAVSIVVWDALRRRHPDAPAWIALATGATLGVFVGASRVLAGQHFPTDVLLSAMLGTGIGTLVTQWHAIPTISGDAATLSPAKRF